MRAFNRKGFTLIELVVVIVIIGILAGIALPKYQDLAREAKIASTKGALGSIRATLTLQYAKSAVAGTAAYPTSLDADDFADNRIPKNTLSGETGIAALLDADPIPSATETNSNFGFWYFSGGANAGKAGAYSDGTEDTTEW